MSAQLGAGTSAVDIHDELVDLVRFHLSVFHELQYAHIGWRPVSGGPLLADFVWPYRVHSSCVFGGPLNNVVHGIVVVLKDGKARLSVEQAGFLEWLKCQDWAVFVCRSAGEAWRQILKYAGFAGKCSCFACLSGER